MNVALRRHGYCFVVLLAVGLAACSGVPVHGTVGGQTINARVDAEVARYYVEDYLTGRRGNAGLDARLDRLHVNTEKVLPGRDQLKQLGVEFSLDFASLYFAERIVRIPANRGFREAYMRAYDAWSSAAYRNTTPLPAAADRYEFVFVPGYLYKRHRMTGADLTVPRNALQAAGYAHHFVATVEDGSIEHNAEIVAAAITERARHGKKLILVSLSKSGPEVALALGALDVATSLRVAGWVNITGTLQGSPFADYSLQRPAQYAGKVDAAGVESMTTGRSRQRFTHFRLPGHMLVVSLLGVPVSSTFSRLAQAGFDVIREHGPNDGMTLLPDMVYPEGLTLVEVGRDHFMVGDDVSVMTTALASVVIQWLESGFSEK